jgi:hypothetical protein
MQPKRTFHFAFAAVLASALLLSACGLAISPTSEVKATASSTQPDWFTTTLTDARTSKTFRMQDFAGKVVLVESIAQWCINCVFQQGETRKMREQLGNPADLIQVSLDVDTQEDEASLKKYAEQFGYDWLLAVAPLEVARGLGNLYGANFLNPPLSPVLLIDRQGQVYPLPFGQKKADALLEIVQPYLAK